MLHNSFIFTGLLLLIKATFMRQLVEKLESLVISFQAPDEDNAKRFNAWQILQVVIDLRLATWIGRTQNRSYYMDLDQKSEFIIMS